MNKYYKGFDKNLKCRDFQFEIGKTYEEETAALCKKGFHACSTPLEVFSYYAPSDSRYCEVELDGISKQLGEDSKVCAKKIKITSEIGVLCLTKAHVEWVKKNIKENKTDTNTGDCSAATNTGDYSAATNTGAYSAATNTGNCSAATNTGYRSAATNTRKYSAATNTGDYSAATNTGYRSAATNTGVCSAAMNTGDCSAATNTGYSSAATNTGDYSAATNTGDCSAATNIGDCSAVEVSGKDSVAIATGLNSKARGSIGCAICIVERDERTHSMVNIRAEIVDGEKIKADVWYTLKNGELVEVND